MASLVERYAEMSETELRQVADNVKDLTPEARKILRAEMLRRHISVKQFNWGAHRPRPKPRRIPTVIGDSAGEYREMDHGGYHAWIHVAVAFVLQVVLLAIIVTKGLDAIFPGISWVGVGIGFGLLATIWIYWDRWRCIEAYASEWCTGILNLSILAVPLVALCYANYRGFRKLRRL
jgi:hypothetical protein